ncbi:MAG: hypothetical protein DWH80_13550 [Planctomycetota bacterium]|nr:MAG: hypothetical protein DWH80_13550 [Planctomycetota bacterium]
MLPDLHRIRSGLSNEIDTFESWRAAVTSTKACGLPPRLSRHQSIDRKRGFGGVFSSVKRRRFSL